MTLLLVTKFSVAANKVLCRQKQQHKLIFSCCIPAHFRCKTVPVINILSIWLHFRIVSITWIQCSASKLCSVYIVLYYIASHFSYFLWEMITLLPHIFDSHEICESGIVKTIAACFFGHYKCDKGQNLPDGSTH